jgi:hypothetical protein
MAVLARLLLVVALCSWSTAVGETSGRDKNFIEKNINFLSNGSRELSLVLRIHIMEEPKASVDAFVSYYDFNDASIEVIRKYVQEYVIPMQSIRSAMWCGVDGQMYLYRIHTDDLVSSVDLHCRGLMLRDEIELTQCNSDIIDAITYQINILTADFEANRRYSKQVMGIWDDVRGITVINPQDASLYWELPPRPEAVIIPPEELSLNVVMATTGTKNRIFGMISSLQELTSRDYLTVLFDGSDQAVLLYDILEYAKLVLECTVLYKIESEALGYWGHAIRNTLGDLPGHFVWHVDDDDIILPGALNSIREHCKDANTLYVFRMRNTNISTAVWKEKNVLRIGGIGTPSGLIPAAFNKLSTWGLYYGGDYDFYANLVPFVRDVVFVDQFIYRYFKL